MKIIRLTEEDLGNMIKASLRGAVNEDVLGDNWYENDYSDDTEDSDVMNNYEPFEDQIDSNHDWGVSGESNIDPTNYDADEPIEFE